MYYLLDFLFSFPPIEAVAKCKRIKEFGRLVDYLLLWFCFLSITSTQFQTLPHLY